MGFFDDLFLGIYDLNRDGKISWEEEWIAHDMIMKPIRQRQEEEEKKLRSKPDYSTGCYSCYDFDYDYDDDCDYDDHSHHSTVEEITIPIKITVEWPGQDALDAIKESDYPNKRKYNAAYLLCELEQNVAILPRDTTPEIEKERCEFILKSKEIAAQYLTPRREFLYAQAVKENFNVPIDIPDEDEEVKTYFWQFFPKIIEKDPALAVKIWVWFIKKFGPYKKYVNDKYTLYSSPMIYFRSDSHEFCDLTIEKMIEDVDFRKEVLIGNPESRSLAYFLVVRALDLDLIQIAFDIFNESMSNVNMTSEGKIDFIDHIIMQGAFLETSNAMKRFYAHIMPIIRKIQDKDIQECISYWLQKLSYCI